MAVVSSGLRYKLADSSLFSSSVQVESAALRNQPKCNAPKPLATMNFPVPKPYTLGFVLHTGFSHFKSNVEKNALELKARQMLL